MIPFTTTVAISYGVRKFLSKESIYTLKLTRRGHHMPEAIQASFHLLKLARGLMEPSVVTVMASAPVLSLEKTLSRPDHTRYLLVAAREGPVSAREIRGVISKKRIADSMTESFGMFSE